MTIRRLRWLAALGLTLTATGVLSAQQPVVWRAARSAQTQAVSPSSPIVTLGRPVAIASTAPLPAATPPRQETTARTTPVPVGGPPRPIIRAQAPDSVLPLESGSRPPAPPRADPRLGDTIPAMAEMGTTIPVGADRDLLPPPPPGVGIAPPQPPEEPRSNIMPLVDRPEEREPRVPTHTVSNPPESVPAPPIAPFPSGSVDPGPGLITDRPVAPGFWEKCRNWLNWGEKGCANGRSSFQSDTSFPRLISPISMPFFFEDPRSLTEIRPLFLYQGMPNKSALTQGGDAFFFGTQLRLALTDRLSFVVHELGLMSIQPDLSTPVFPGGSGFAEIKLGPKYTFWRNADTGTVAAAGLIFEIPAGSSRIFQDVGSLSLDPYLSIGQSFGALPGGWGSLNLVGNTGYSFSIDDARSEFFYLNLHLDYNIANFNTIFPLIEMNWIRYTRAGNNADLGFEGADFANFGSSSRRGKDYLSIASGLRYRFTDNVFGGAAVEFPVTREKGINDYRLTFDVIFRY